MKRPKLAIRLEAKLAADAFLINRLRCIRASSSASSSTFPRRQISSPVLGRTLAFYGADRATYLGAKISKHQYVKIIWLGNDLFVGSFFLYHISPSLASTLVSYPFYKEMSGEREKTAV